MRAVTSTSRLGQRVAAALAIPLFALVAAGPAFAGAGAGASSIATIRIEGSSPNTLRFVGPKTINEGEFLQVVNETNPRKVGPQTFTLVEPEEIPKTAKQRELCLSKGHLCEAIMGWHGIRRGGKPARTLVDAGSEGWDTAGTLTSRGDSWYTNKKGQSIEEAVSPGATAAPIVLTFMSAFDPSLHGRITVLPVR